MKTEIKRTQDEILERYNIRKGNDTLGFECDIYLEYLDFEHAKPFLKQGITEEIWSSAMAKKDPKTAMKDYMKFAWDKAINYRGISAARSIAYYIAWLWLDGAEELSKEIADYIGYGQPQLIDICKYLDVDYRQYEEKWDCSLT